MTSADILRIDTIPMASFRCNDCGDQYAPYGKTIISPASEVPICGICFQRMNHTGTPTHQDVRTYFADEIAAS